MGMRVDKLVSSPMGAMNIPAHYSSLSFLKHLNSLETQIQKPWIYFLSIPPQFPIFFSKSNATLSLPNSQSELHSSGERGISTQKSENKKSDSIGASFKRKKRKTCS